MYTVILYWQGKGAESAALDPERYGFLFSYAHVQDQVLRRPYAGPGTLGHTVTELNWSVGGRAEWRLILFDGRLAGLERGEQDGSPPPDTIRREWMPLLLCLSGENAEEARLEAAPPQEIWYLGCSVRGTYTGMGQNEFAYAKILLTEEERRRFLGQAGAGAEESPEGTEEAAAPYRALDAADIPFLRMCWTEVQPGGGLCRRRESFRLCCILLTLACNEISPTILNGGYLYQVGIGLDWERLADRTGELRRQSTDLAEQVQTAWAYCLQAQGRTAPYVTPVNLRVPRTKPPKRPEDRKTRNLDRKELKRGGASALDRKLRSTHQWLYEQLFFPQGGVYENLARPIELESRNSEAALDAAGQASVQLELSYAVQNFHQQRQRDNNPLRFEQDLAGVERRVRDRVEDQPTDAEHLLVRRVLAALEGVTFAPFVMIRLNKLTEFLAPRFPAIFNAVKRRFSGAGWTYLWKILLFFAAAVAVCAVTLVMFKICARIADRWAVFQYNRYLSSALRQQGKRRKNTFDFMEYILWYRYHWILQRRQQEIAGEKKRRKDCLRHHSAVQKNAAAACELLEQLSGEDRREVPLPRETPPPKIDFSREPGQDHYFWRAAHHQVRGLNGGGYELDVVFDFITEIELYRTAELRKLDGS